MVLAPAPADGLPMQAMAGFMDEGCKGWNPRPATEEEKEFICGAGGGDATTILWLRFEARRLHVRICLLRCACDCLFGLLSSDLRIYLTVAYT